MRWSQAHIPTLRDDPAEAGTPGRRLLLRAGHVRRTGPGRDALLPMAFRARARIMGIVRSELDRIGGQEMLPPSPEPPPAPAAEPAAPVPADPAGAAGGRDEFAVLALDLQSYRRLPQRWYRFGPAPDQDTTALDARSLDIDRAGLDASLAAFYDALTRIFARLGLPVIAAEAPGGADGSASTAFRCPAESGTDPVVQCPGCGAAATPERAAARVPEVVDGPGPDSPEPFDTPGVRTIEDLAAGYGAPGERQIKTLVYVLDGRLTLVLLRGDHALDEGRLREATGAAAVRAAGAEEIRAALGALPGSLGAVGVTGLPVVADGALRGRRAMVTGANRDDVHLRGVDVGRDIEVGAWAALRAVRAGDPCARCGAPLRVVRAVELGRVTGLGDGPARAAGAAVPDADGRRVPLVMGGCGLAVERAMEAIVEHHHDERGIVWPVAVAPYQVALVVAQSGDEACARAGEELYAGLAAAGIDVIIDDRSERAGVKFRDAELTGIPVRVTVGRRGLAEGVVEVTPRSGGETATVPLDAAVPAIRELLAG
ncbi:proline--tRNA ligase [Actinomadura viridis]|uniref:Prolyl-tRNA synthetase n=1 Tax=Actinomadura viridis TaxID=58110 RepID=A0A931DRL7_9ACTN|nr:YbaK/EbsC family protein [Actinomadura viridis]MBG6093493.1 prolyl-tRNA synthetase [Actinomadura viridis]